MCSVTLLFNFAEQPGAGMGPIIVGSTGGTCVNLGGFLKGQAHETRQLDQFRFDLALVGEFVKSFTHREEFVFIPGRGNFNTVKIHALLVSAVTQGTLAAGFVNEDAAHCLGGGGKEMGATELGLSFPTSRNQASCTRAVACNVWLGASLTILDAASLRSSP